MAHMAGLSGNHPEHQGSMAGTAGTLDMGGRGGVSLRELWGRRREHAVLLRA